MTRLIPVVLKFWEASRRSLAMGETSRFLLLSIIIGLFAGAFIVCFHLAIESLSWVTIHTIGEHHPLRTLLSPALGAGLATALVMFYFRTSSGSGVNNTKAALYVSDGYIPFSSVVGRFLTSTLSIGTGNPLGAEDPALQMGAGIASYLGRVFRLTREKMRMIAPIGAAAGIGAAFNTPITAVLFVMEEVVAAWNGPVMGSIVLSAVSAVVVSRWYLGDESLFSVPEFTLSDPSELGIYALMGVVGGIMSAYFSRYVLRLRKHTGRYDVKARALLPLGVGLLVGAAGIALPEVLGTGYGAIDGALHDRFPWQMLLLFGLVKVLLVSLCFSVRTPGGLFAPTLFIGAMVGGGLGAFANEYSPTPVSSSSAYVLVGMGVFFAGLFRAPMTSIFMVFEVSGNYVVILPVMIANTLSYLISRQIEPESFFQEVGAQDGLELPSVEAQREAPTLSVEDAMNPSRTDLVDQRSTASEAIALMKKRELRHALIERSPGRWYWIDRRDLEKGMENGGGERTVVQVAHLHSVVRVYPDMTLDAAMRMLGPYPVLPVSSRANPNQLRGTLTIEDVHRAYGIPNTPK